MKKTTITITYDEEKLSALKLYLEQKNSNTEDELTKAIETLYTKSVPSGVREFIDLRSGTLSTPAVIKQKKTKSIIPSVTATSSTEENNANIENKTHN